MTDPRAQRLARMNTAAKAATPKKDIEYPIRSQYSSLIDMINIRGDKYPSYAHLEA